MVRCLQKRKFRLIIRWKLALKNNDGFRLPAQNPFPYALIFRAFDEIIRRLKGGSPEGHPDSDTSILSAIPDDRAPGADQYVEMFLTGRDVLDEFVRTDPFFCGMFSSGDRDGLARALDDVFKQLVDREMLAYSLRFGLRVSRHRLQRKQSSS